jgi:heptaprenylglyceryl phosphate synthase
MKPKSMDVNPGFTSESDDGGIRSPEKERDIAHAGANIIVISNLLQTPGFEKTPGEIVRTVRQKA